MGAFNYLKYRKFDKFSPDFYFAKNENFPKRGFKVKPKPSSCVVCSLMKLGVGYAEGSGNGTNKIMLVGEALGAREAQLGVPFVGEAGVQLNRTLERVPMGRQEFRITNAVRCRPPKNWLDGAPWEADALMNCSRYFEEELQKYTPKVVVPMGNIPTKLLLGDGVRGKGGIERRRGYVYECTYGEHNFHVIPTYHPAFIMRGQQKLTDVQAIDINRAIRVMRNGYKEPPYNYIEHPTLPDAWNYYEKCVIAAGNGKDLAADIETPNSGGAEEDEYGDIIDTDIIRISFSYEPHTAITIPFTYAYLSVIEAILALPWRYTVFWNQEFDVPRLKSKGMTIGKVLDAMYMWHFLQSNLPKGLGYVSTFFTELREWKSLSMEQPEYYSCVDADATIQNHIKIKSLLESQGRFEMFREHYIELHPIATMMARSGMPIDIEQQQKFRKEIDNELRRVDEAVQAVLPDAVKPFVARRKIPADADIGRAVEGRKGGGVWGVNSDGEWGIRMPFLCNSPKQVVAYMRYQGHAVPTNYKTGNPTTSADEIEKLADKYPDDPLYARIIQTREYKKIIGQYVDGYAPDPDGLVRTHFNRKPSTWRWNSENPNVQNVLKRGDFAKEYRKQFVALPGYTLVEMDYKALEAQLVGVFAEDKEYIKAAKLGVHSILMARVQGIKINLDSPPNEVKKVLKALKTADPVMYDSCKHVVHGSNYLGTPRRLRIGWPDLFPSVGAAKKIQDLYFSTLARKVRRWQQDVLNLAYHQHFLEGPYGYRHYFWDVLHYVGKQLEWGTDAKKAVAFLPQSTGAGLISEAILRIYRQFPEVFKWLKWMIHDSLIAMVPNSELSYGIGAMKACMEYPEPRLGGLSVEVEIEVGKNWGELHEYDGEITPITIRS